LNIKGHNTILTAIQHIENKRAAALNQIFIQIPGLYFLSLKTYIADLQTIASIITVDHHGKAMVCMAMNVLDIRNKGLRFSWSFDPTQQPF
jgi:hypothetical protein